VKLKKKSFNTSWTPDKVAIPVYANQNGNGNEASGDGWAHIGAGVTVNWKEHELFTKWMGLKKTPTKEEIAEK
jgi:predicted chitinase